MRPSFLSLIAVIALVLSVSGPVLRAFPPAPFYTIYGIVRDQVGATLTAQGADLILLRDNVEIARTRILSAVQGDLNYEFPISIDTARAGSTRMYAHKAVSARGVYSLHVEMNGERFYPIEVAGTLRTGHGGGDKKHEAQPDFTCDTLLDAVRLIVRSRA